MKLMNEVGDQMCVAAHLSKHKWAWVKTYLIHGKTRVYLLYFQWQFMAFILAIKL